MGGSRDEPRATFMIRFARGRRLDRNPLRRTSDRAETVLLLLLVVAFLATAPVAALISGTRVHAIAQRTALAQRASRHQVTATVVAAPAVPASDAGNIDAATQVRWTAPNGRAITGQVIVPFGTQPGAKVRVWTTRGGQLAAEPLGDPQVADLTVIGGVAGAAAVAAVLALSGLLVHWSLNRRRMAAWEFEWRATGPRWTTRR